MTESFPWAIVPVIRTTTTVNTGPAAIGVRHQVLRAAPTTKDMVISTAKTVEQGGPTLFPSDQGDAKLNVIMKMTDPELAVSFLRYRSV